MQPSRRRGVPALTLIGATLLVAVSCASGGRIEIDRSEPTTPAVPVAPVSRSQLDELLPRGVEIQDEIPVPSTDDPSFTVRVPGEDAITTWELLRSLVPETATLAAILQGSTVWQFWWD